jgi:hypothetical protein
VKPEFYQYFHGGMRVTFSFDQELQLGVAARARLQVLAQTWPDCRYADLGRELCLHTAQLSLCIVQSKRSPVTLKCWFFLGDTALFFEDVWFAVRGRELASPYQLLQHVMSGELPFDMTRSLNGQYVDCLVDFCIEENALLEPWPVTWLNRARAHHARQRERYFLDIARSTVDQNLLLWQRWSAADVLAQRHSPRV